MGITLVSTISALTIAVNTIVAPSPSPKLVLTNPSFQNQIIINKYLTYKVEKNDSLASVAKSFYGNSDYWTTIWNDNSNIKDPSIIEKGEELRINKIRPEKIDELKPELAKRREELQKQKLLAIASLSTFPTPQDKTNQATNLQPTQTFSSPSSLSDSQINFLGNCESGMTASRNSGNGYYGAFQFSIGTWHSMGTAYDRADEAPLDIQIDAVQRLLARSSIFTQFPGCAIRMKASGLL